MEGRAYGDEATGDRGIHSGGSGARLPEATPVKNRTVWWVLAFFLIPVFGIGLFMIAIMTLSPFRWGPCPYCEANGRWPDRRLARHTACQRHSIRKGPIIHPADDKSDQWDGRTIS